MISEKELIDLAREARLHAYAKYSGFPVGAALLSEDGKVFCGCNVENISFGLTCCAERNALFAAILAGVSRFSMIAIIADSHEPASPCGACRQVLAEFAPDLQIVSANLAEKVFRANLSELLPRASVGIMDR